MSFKIYQSKMNKNYSPEPYEMIHSEIGFDNVKFSNDVLEEMAFVGLSIDELSASTYINYERMKKLLKGKLKYDSEEIRIISQRLNILV